MSQGGPVWSSHVMHGRYPLPPEGALSECPIRSQNGNQQTPRQFGGMVGGEPKARSNAFLSGTLVNRLHRLRTIDTRNGGSARHRVHQRQIGSSLDDALPCICTGRSTSDCRCGGRLPEIRTIPDPTWIHGSCPWILLAVYFGWLCIFSIFHIVFSPIW